VDRDLVKLARRMEEQEAAAWARCAEAVAAVPGNPLDAVVGRSGAVPLVALRAVDRVDLNRVIGLGVPGAVGERELDRVWSFYEDNDQNNFRIEVTPVSRPAALVEWIGARGLLSEAMGTFKLWRPVTAATGGSPSVSVRRLSRDDADALASLSVAAWGAWNTPTSLGPWFGATVGQGGARHYGVYDGERLVATGALFAGDGLGWFGFDATHPRYQGRGLRQAISSARMADAAAEGCSWVHAESALPPSGRALRDGWRLLYEKSNYSTAPAEVTAAAAGSHRRRLVRSRGPLSSAPRTP
jgi:GNAT superfamily N-acetyltransferase